MVTQEALGFVGSLDGLESVCKLDLNTVNLGLKPGHGVVCGCDPETVDGSFYAEDFFLILVTSLCHSFRLPIVASTSCYSASSKYIQGVHLDDFTQVYHEVADASFTLGSFISIAGNLIKVLWW